MSLFIFFKGNKLFGRVGSFSHSHRYWEMLERMWNLMLCILPDKCSEVIFSSGLKILFLPKVFLCFKAREMGYKIKVFNPLENHRIFCVERYSQGSSILSLKWMAHMGIEPTALVFLAPCSNQLQSKLVFCVFLWVESSF